MIKISVIIPVYKVPLEYLRKCFNTLTTQTMQECEFIVVSDGAPKAECSICEEYATKDYRFKFFNQIHAGVSATKNFALKKASGEYITFADADDWVEPNFLNEIYEIASSKKLDILNWNYRLENTPVENQVKPLINHSIDLLDNNQRNIFLNNILINQDFGQSLSSCCTRLYNALFLKENKFFFSEDLSIGEDKAFNYQAYIVAKRMGYINKTYYNYRMRNESTVHKFIPNSFPIYLKYINYIKSICHPENQRSLGKEFLNVFFHSLNTSYFPPNRSVSIKESINYLKTIIYSNEFQQALYLLKGETYPFSLQFYLFCLHKQLLFPIYVRAIRYLFQRKFLCSYKQ